MVREKSEPSAALKSVLTILLVPLFIIVLFMILFFTKGLGDTILLPVLAISGVAVLLAVLAVVAVVFGTLGLDDPAQPLGLPEGSIRAVIALSLVVLFAILSVYLVDFLGSEEFRNADEATTKDAKDLAKQLLTIIGTLMTAVAGFYFGAQTASGGKNSSGTDEAAAPQPRSVTPPSESLKSIHDSGTPLDVTITGENLNSVREVKFVDQRTGSQILATGVMSNNHEVTCKLPVNADTPLGTRDVIVGDGGEKSATVKGAFGLVD